MQMNAWTRFKFKKKEIADSISRCAKFSPIEDLAFFKIQDHKKKMCSPPP